MVLLNRGRLSVQRVEQAAWEAIQTMADKGGWGEGQAKKTKSRKKQVPEVEKDGAETSSEGSVRAKGGPRKRKAQQAEGDDDSTPARRSTRMRTKG